MTCILVVDDDKKIVRLVSAYLEQAGYEVLTAYDGQTALPTIRRDRPDLVVLDLMLPDADGWEITRQVLHNLLANARQLVQAQGGKIGVESDGPPGQGSRFWFTLPLVSSKSLVEPSHPK
jgi:CheY-like chemotaxis protein